MTNIDNIDTIVEETTSAIEDKIQQSPFHNRAQRRAFAKKMGKSGRAKMGTISETAKKLNYINLIEKLRDLNNSIGENEHEDTTKDS